MLARVGALVLVLLAAGCVTTPADVDAASVDAALEASRLAPPDIDLSTAIVSNHGAPYMHALPDLHSGSYRMELVGYDPMTIPGAGDHPIVQNSAWTAITLYGRIACVSHWAGTGGFGGATLVDFDDPAAPTVIASIPSMMLGARCMFTDDGKYLLLAGYGGVTGGLPLPMPLAETLSFGISVYDAANPSNPTFLFHSGIGGEVGNPNHVLAGPHHNIDTVTVDGANYVFQTYTGNILKLDADGRKFDIVGTMEHSNHDFWIGPHPITAAPMLVTGTNSGGTAIFDFADPEAPVLLGTWEPEEGSGLEGWHRQFPLAKPVGGKALLVVAGEDCGSGRSLPYSVLDWTDPTTPTLLGSWQIPGEPAITEPGQLCSMSAHEFNEFDGYIASGNYHAGVWVFDVGTPARAVEPVTIGYYEPHEDPRAHGGTRNTPFAWSPDVWGAYFDDRGYVIAADWYSGFYVLKVPGVTRE